MSFSFSAFSVPLFANALICALFALHGWRHRSEYRLALPFTRLMAAIAGWSLAYGFEILGDNVQTKNLWETFIIVCIALAGAFYFLLAVEYTGREHWLTPRNTLLIISPALLTCALALTNGFHHLIWTEIQLDHSGPFIATLPVRGLWFWFHAGVTWLYMVIGLVYYALSLIRAPYAFRVQGIIMITGGLFPVMGNLLHITGFIQIPGLDLGPFFSAVSGILMGWGLFRYRFLDLAPVAQRAVLEGMREGIVVLDGRDRVVEINPAAKKLLGLINTDPIGQQEALKPLLEKISDQSEIQIGRGQASRWLTVSTTPLVDGRDRPIGTLVVLHDTTEEHHLEQLRDDLQQMIVHDLRNPLTIIHTGLNLLVDNPALSAYDRRILDMSRSNSSRAVMLINAILDANQLEQGKIPIEASAVRISEIVHEVVASIAPLAQIQSITIESELPKDLPPAWVDERLMVRILQNLVDNAVKFSPKNGRVSVRAFHINDQLQISVSDEGPGIPPPLQSRVFDKFASGDNLRRGSGLGLAFCKLAVEAHGGEIRVDSSGERGTTFSFSVRVHHDQTEEE